VYQYAHERISSLFSFPLLWREGKIGDRVIDAFFEKRQQIIRFVPAAEIEKS
jgi:hypothetical protein